MKTSRRSFLAFLSTLPLIRTFKGPDPAQEEYLYSHDMRVPFMGGHRGGASESDIIAMELERVQQHITTLFDRDDTFFTTLENAQGVGTRRRKGRGNRKRGLRG